MKIRQKYHCKTIAILLSIILTLAFFASCTDDTPNESGLSGEQSSPAETSTPEEIMYPFEPYEREELPADELESKCAPYPTGDFIQPWLAADWSVSRWETHLEALKAAGIEFVILQFTSSYQDGKYTDFNYPSSLIGNEEYCTPDCKTYDTVASLLEAAKNTGMKVWLGIGGCSDWWGYAFSDIDWCVKRATETNFIIKELYDMYKHQYPDTFVGWYWAWEMFGNKGNHEKNWAEMININLDYMTELDPTMPCMFSTYYSMYENCTPERFTEVWSNLFSLTRFREGDIWAPMDGLGTLPELTYTQREQLLRCYVEAMENEDRLTLWFNVENFKDGGGAAELARFADQCIICSKYAEGLITFSYTHYYSPTVAGRAYTKDYQTYVKWAKQEFGEN